MAIATQKNILRDSWTLSGFRLNSGILLLVFLFCYSGVFTTLASTWWNNTVYSHGFLIPFISAYLIWLRRRQLSAIKYSPSLLPGLAVLTLGLMMHAVGHAGGVEVLQEVSIIVTISGIVLMFLGAGFLKALAFPILYLSFMFTTWGTLTDKMNLPSQLFAANLGTWLLQSIGIPAARNGVFIELPRITLEVARECSGVNYLIAIAAIGIPVAYITLRSWGRRLILVGGAIVIAFLANGFRVALIGTLSYYGLAGDLHGPYHILQGMFVSAIGFAILVVGAWVLSKGDRETTRDVEALQPPSRRPIDQSDMPAPGASRFPLLLAAALMTVVGGYVNFLPLKQVPLKTDLALLPYTINGWRGFDSEPVISIFRKMGVDHDLSRTYTNGDGKGVINLYVGYYKRQEQGKELVNYSSERLHDGATTQRVPLDSGGVVWINRLERDENGARQTLLFWYDLNGRIVADKYAAKAYTAWDSLTGRRSNGAVVIIAIEHLEDQVSDEALLKEGASFVQGLIPVLNHYLPR